MQAASPSAVRAGAGRACARAARRSTALRPGASASAAPSDQPSVPGRRRSEGGRHPRASAGARASQAGCRRTSREHPPERPHLVRIAAERVAQEGGDVVDVQRREHEGGEARHEGEALAHARETGRIPRLRRGRADAKWPLRLRVPGQGGEVGQALAVQPLAVVREDDEWLCRRGRGAKARQDERRPRQTADGPGRRRPWPPRRRGKAAERAGCVRGRGGVAAAPAVRRPVPCATDPSACQPWAEDSKPGMGGRSMDRPANPTGRTSGLRLRAAPNVRPAMAAHGRSSGWACEHGSTSARISRCSITFGWIAGPDPPDTAPSSGRKAKPTSPPAPGCGPAPRPGSGMWPRRLA